jgi:hypothetical protein
MLSIVMNAISAFTEYWRASANLLMTDYKIWYTIQYLSGCGFSILAVLMATRISKIIGPHLGFFISSVLYSMTLWFYYPQNIGDQILIHEK